MTAITHPYDLPRFTLALGSTEGHAEDPLSPEISLGELLAEPTDPGQWTLACLARTYVMTTCPVTSIQGIGGVGQGSWNSDGIKLTWPLSSAPNTYRKLKDLRAGFGHHEPDYVVLADGPLTAAFKFVRSMSLDEISGYFVTDWTRFAEVYTILSEAALERDATLGLFATTAHGSQYLKTHGYTERAPSRRCGPDPTEIITEESPVFIARVPGPFRCPMILGKLLGVM